MRNIEWQDRLGPGEELVWSGAPTPGLRFRLIDIPLSIFGFVFASIGGVAAFSALPWTLLIPHFWIGLYIAFGRYVVERIVRDSTSYAITDQRALIVVTWPMRKTSSIDARSVAGLELTEHRDGTGTIRFMETRERSRWSTSRRRTNWANLTSAAGPAFEYIEHPHQVMELLRPRPAPLPGAPTWAAGSGVAPDPMITAATVGLAGLPARLPPAPPSPPPAPPPPPPSTTASGSDPEPDAPGPFWRPPAR